MRQAVALHEKTSTPSAEWTSLYLQVDVFKTARYNEACMSEQNVIGSSPWAHGNRAPPTDQEALRSILGRGIRL